MLNKHTLENYMIPKKLVKCMCDVCLPPKKGKSVMIFQILHSRTVVDLGRVWRCGPRVGRSRENGASFAGIRSGIRPWWQNHMHCVQVNNIFLFCFFILDLISLHISNNDNINHVIFSTISLLKDSSVMTLSYHENKPNVTGINHNHVP